MAKLGRPGGGQGDALAGLSREFGDPGGALMQTGLQGGALAPAEWEGELGRDPGRGWTSNGSITAAQS